VLRHCDEQVNFYSQFYSQTGELPGHRRQKWEGGGVITGSSAAEVPMRECKTKMLYTEKKSA
jgi:hypothetical protein